MKTFKNNRFAEQNSIELIINNRDRVERIRRLGAGVQSTKKKDWKRWKLFVTINASLRRLLWTLQGKLQW